MKRIFSAIAILGLMSFPLLNLAVAGKEEKVLVCHITSETDEGARVLVEGHVIEVSGNALEAHLAHGDHIPGPSRVKGEYCFTRHDKP